MKKFKRILIGIVLVLAILLVVVAITLKRGITFNEYSFANIHVDRAHLVWDTRLKLNVDKLTIKSDADTSNTSGSFEVNLIPKILNTTQTIKKWFSAITIQEIQAGAFTITLDYHENVGGHLHIESTHGELESGIIIDGAIVTVDISKLVSSDFNSHATGKVRIDTDNRSLSGTLEAMLADSLPIKLDIQADRNSVSFSGYGTESIQDITPVVNLFGLRNTITPWIIDYLSAKQVSLQSISGSLPYDDPAEILKTLVGNVKIETATYTFAQGLDPVVAGEIDVVFEKGVLKIEPIDASVYGLSVEGSSVDIDFSQKPFILTAHILTQAQASGDVLTVLDHYGIPFPILQTSGSIDADLTLNINLSKKGLESTGRFKSQNSGYIFGQQKFFARQLDIGLKNTAITVHALDASMEEMVSAEISGEIDLSTRFGELVAKINEFSYHSETAEIRLINQPGSQTRMTYSASKDGESLKLTPSRWQMGQFEMDIAAFTSDFDLKRWAGKLPATDIAISSWLSASASGSYTLSPLSTELDITLLKLIHDSLKLDQPEIGIKLQIGDGIDLQTTETARLSVAGIPFSLQPSSVSLSESELRLNNGGIELDSLFSAGLSGSWDFNDQTGLLSLAPFNLSVDGNEFLVVDQSLDIVISAQDRFTANTPLLGLEARQTEQNGWSVSLDTLAKISEFSPLLQRYRIEAGAFELNSTDGSLPWMLNGEIDYPLNLLLQGDSPVNRFEFSGAYDGKAVSLSINDNIQVGFSEKVSISSDGIGFNLPALMRAFKKTETVSDRPEPGGGESHVQINLNAKNSFVILSDTARIPADAFNVMIDGPVIEGDVSFHNGFAAIEIEAEDFALAGFGFDKDFLESLLPDIDLAKGEIDFSAFGSFDNINGVFRVQDTVIKSHQHLTHLLAFVNTIPALLSFHVPNLGGAGLPAKEIYSSMSFQNDILDFKSFRLDSDELDLRAEGSWNLNDNVVDVLINMSARLGKSLRENPLAKVLPEKAKPHMVTLTAEGDADDAKLTQSRFKDVPMLPYRNLQQEIKLPQSIQDKLQAAAKN